MSHVLDHEWSVELASEADVPAILACANWAQEHTAANFATEPEPLAQWMDAFRATEATHPWLVARDGGRVIGFARGVPHKARGAYRWTADVSVYIDPASHGKGVGRSLYRVLLATMRAQGYVTLIAGITEGNAASVRLHERFGFKACGTYHRVGWKFGRWYDVGYWDLALQSDYLPPSALRGVRDVWPKVLAGLENKLESTRVFLDAPGVMELIRELNAELDLIYPEPGANFFKLDEDEVKGDRGAFLVARLDGEAVGCGAIRMLELGGEKAGELKRMYVPPRWRGLGISKAILSALERQAKDLGAKRALLETGERQRAAVGLYERCGYARIEPFGEYVGSPHSLCMGKSI